MFGNESASGTIVRTVRKGVSEGGGGAWSKQERARDGGERVRERETERERDTGLLLCLVTLHPYVWMN